MDYLYRHHDPQIGLDLGHLRLRHYLSTPSMPNQPLGLSLIYHRTFKCHNHHSSLKAGILAIQLLLPVEVISLVVEVEVTLEEEEGDGSKCHHIVLI